MVYFSFPDHADEMLASFMILPVECAILTSGFVLASGTDLFPIDDHGYHIHDHIQCFGHRHMQSPGDSP